MKRRTNKSHRVPNVKLRPGEAQSSSNLAAIESSWPDDSQFRSDDTSFKDNCPRPFRNVVLCATGISDKPALFKKALELGASAISAFTDKVTHLVAVNHGGPKYKCALEHNVPIVTPSWITDNYDIWLHGDDVEDDLERSIESHRLPVFSDVVVCLSGIPEIERRADIRRIVEQQGGSYVKAIERPVRVTHLLCSGDETTDKMRLAEKFVNRGEAEIHMVWEDWFWDSLKMKGRLEEARYNVRNPRPPPVVLRSTQPHVPDSAGPSRSNSMQAAPAPVRPVEDHDDILDEAARIKIVPDMQLKLWTGLLERRGYEVAGGEIVRSPSKTQSRQRSPSPVHDRRRDRQRAGGVISAVRSTNTFEAVDKDAAPSRPLAFQRASKQNQVKPPEAGPSKQSAHSSEQSLPKIFSGMRFLLLGEAETVAVTNAIERSGGVVVFENVDIDIYIVRLSSGSSVYRMEQDEVARSKYRTECWLERCIHEERVCVLDDHVSFKPLDIDLPVAGASSVLIGLSGLDQSESCHTRRLLKAFGINLIPMFSRKATHLLCPSAMGLKYNKALEWGIPVVSNDWLEAIASSGAIPPPSEDSIDRKGKGRAKEGRERAQSVVGDAMQVDKHMHDITNSPPADPEVAKAGPLDRQASEDKRTRGGFGEPTEMLGSMSSASSSSSYAHPSSVKPLTPGSPYIKEQSDTQTREESAPSHHSLRSNKSRNLTNQSTPSRQSSLGVQSMHEHKRQTTGSTENDEEEPRDNDDDQMLRVPSSTSPSPLKIPNRGSSVSPGKLDQGAALALQESIASLLGKRSIPEEDEDDGADSLPRAESAQGRSGAGASKRKRAQRVQPPAAQRGKATRSRPLAPPDADDVAISLSAFEPYGHGSHPGGPNATGDDQQQFELEHSARVIYEDPAQVEERQRLMNLLKPTTPATSSTKSRVTKTKKSGGGESQSITSVEESVVIVGESETLSERTQSVKSASGSVSASARVTRRSTRMSGA